MILVGYHPTGAYKLYDPAKKKMTFSRDVMVLEKEYWNWQENMSSLRRIGLDVLGEDNDSAPAALADHVPHSDPDTPPVDDAADSDDSVATDHVLRPQRQRNRPERYSEYQTVPDHAVNDEGDLIHLALLADVEPLGVEEALEKPVWKAAMIDELTAIEKNQTWSLVHLPPNKHKIGVKWVFKQKLNPDGSIAKHKARLVARGFLQKPGLDYSEVFAPVARLETIRLVVSIASARNWPIFQLDVKSAFLNGPLEEEAPGSSSQTRARAKHQSKHSGPTLPSYRDTWSID